ncbi:MAG: 5'-nucleotidase C-terminal domain-containing protein [Pirellulales bacterium]|nr:5'-nucleotidase C-terminal domain-containing protein [Pirellulales bacterium]
MPQNLGRFSLAALAIGLFCAADSMSTAYAQYSVTVLHNNDGESRLISYTDSLSQYGGAARFKTQLDQTRAYYQSLNHGVVSIYAGDTFLAGPQFQASLDSGAPGSRTFYDALAISRMGYDASILGNHEFDFGPDVLAEFIGDAQTTNATTYLSSNLNFAAEAGLQSLVTAGTIAPTKMLNVTTAAGIKKIGIIGATTETLSFVSSPGAVVVNPVAAAVNTQIANLQMAGADHIILAGHLQGISTDNTLVASLNPGIDLIIAGGGDEILRNPTAISPKVAYTPSAPASIVDTGLIPGDSPVTLSGSLTGVPNNYPLTSTVTDLGGNNIPLVTTGGNYGYLGRVTLNFDNSGNLTGIDNSSGPQRVASTVVDATHGVAADPLVQAEVVTPVQNFVAGLAANDLANTSVQLLHGGSPTIRSRETNLGNVVADGLLRAAQQRAVDFGVDLPAIAIVNGGGIRANIAAGDVTQLNTFSVSPFGNFVSVVEDVKLADLKLLLENAYSRTTDGPNPGIDPVGADGRFAHLAGMEVVYDITKPGFAFNSAGVVTTPAQRVLEIEIGGIPVLQNGMWLVDPLATTVDMATLNFSAGGGDQYFRTSIGGLNTYMSQLYGFTSLGVTDQNALQDYIEFMANGNASFDVSTFKPEYAIQQRFSGGRISAVPEPGTWMLLAFAGAAGLIGLRRRMA